MNQVNLTKEELPHKKFTKGESIFLEGEKGKYAYIIEKGEVEIVTQIKGENKLLNTLYSGDMFGELALIDKSPRSASAIAKTDVLAIIIHSEQLQEIIEKTEPIVKLLLKSVMRYFRSETERLNLYRYSEDLKLQMAIRQEAMEQAFGEIHNGPLQNLAVLIKDVQKEKYLSDLFFNPLKNIDLEIRNIGEKLTEKSEEVNRNLNFFGSKLSSNLMHLGEGTILELNTPLHELFYSIFTLTLQREFPHFNKIKIKVRDFQPYPYRIRDLALKRQICFCLEEAICNVGKHAQDATKIIATSKLIDDVYVIKVEDNGLGLTSEHQNKGTKLCRKLTQKLNGTLIRKTLSTGGVLFEMSWKT